MPPFYTLAGRLLWKFGTDAPQKAGQMGIADFLESVYLSERAVGQRAAEQLRITIRHFQRWAGRSVAIEKLDAELVNAFLIHGAGRWAPKTVKRQRGDLVAMWNYAHSVGLNDSPVSRVRSIKVPQRAPRAWHLDELARLLAAAAAITGCYPNGIHRAIWWQAVIRVVYDTALRRGDVLMIQTCDIDRLRGLLVHTQRKTGRIILCPLRPETIRAIDASFPPARLGLFPWPYHDRTWHEHWRRLILIPAGLAIGRSEGLQKLRRTSASQLEAVFPGSAPRHLGHAAPDLAYRHYVDPLIAGAFRPLPPSPT